MDAARRAASRRTRARESDARASRARDAFRDARPTTSAIYDSYNHYTRRAARRARSVIRQPVLDEKEEPADPKRREERRLAHGKRRLLLLGVEIRAPCGEIRDDVPPRPSQSTSPPPRLILRARTSESRQSSSPERVPSRVRQPTRVHRRALYSKYFPRSPASSCARDSANHAR